MKDSFLRLSEKNHSITCITDVRACRLVASCKSCQIDIFPCSDELSKISFLFQDSEKDRFHKWIGGLFLHANLKPKGLLTNEYTPKVVMPENVRVLLKTEASVFMPNLNFKVASQDTNAGPFTPSKWIPVTLILHSNGFLEIVYNGAIVQRIYIGALFSSRIRLLDHSVFSLGNVIYIPDADSSPETTILRHTQAQTCTEDKAVYLQLLDKSEISPWVRTLKSLARLQVFAPSTANPLKSARMVRYLNFQILEAKLDKTRCQVDVCSCAYYVETAMRNRIWGRTSISKPGKYPFWREDFAIQSIPLAVLPDFTLRVWARGHGDPSTDTLMGSVTLDYETVKQNKNNEKSFPIQKNGVTTGSLSVNIKFEELMVAASCYYRELEQTLERVPFADLATLVLSKNHLQGPESTSLSDVFLNIAMACPWPTTTVSWLSALISQEIKNTYDFIVTKRGSEYLSESHVCSNVEMEFKKNVNNSLFRGNSTLTKSMETFMRMVGQDHLSDTVGKFVAKLVKDCPDLEINPAKIHVPEGRVLEDVIEENQQRLLIYANEIWSLITNSVDSIPISMKAVFRHLAVELHETLHFPKPVVYNCISGFLFLRLYCPSLLNPKQFSKGVTCSDIAHAQRSLTLVAKIIMCFANRSRFGMKEPWLIPMNTFFDEHEDELLQFYKKVILKELTVTEVDALIENQKQSQLDLNEDSIPLAERLSSEFLIDKDFNYSRLLSIWNTTLLPNKDEFFQSVSSSEPSSPVLGNSQQVGRNASLEQFYNVCQKTYTTIDKLTTFLMEPEVFETGSISRYAQHIDFVWDQETDTLGFKSTLKPTESWYTPNNSTRRLSSFSVSNEPYRPPVLRDMETVSPASNFVLHSPRSKRPSSNIPTQALTTDLAELRLSSPRVTTFNEQGLPLEKVLLPSSSPAPGTSVFKPGYAIPPRSVSTGELSKASSGSASAVLGSTRGPAKSESDSGLARSNSLFGPRVAACE